jgi:hypothetical protein
MRRSFRQVHHQDHWYRLFLIVRFHQTPNISPSRYQATHTCACLRQKLQLQYAQFPKQSLVLQQRLTQFHCQYCLQFLVQVGRNSYGPNTPLARYLTMHTYGLRQQQLLLQFCPQQMQQPAMHFPFRQHHHHA